MTKNILFMGTPQFSVSILKALIASEYTVIGVVTQPDRPVGRKKILTPSPVKQVAVDHNIPVYQPEKLVGSSELEELLTLPIDLIVTAAYGQFLPGKLLNHPRLRAINVHASLLPKYRGGAPIQYAIMNGDDKTGVSIMYMEKTMDSGDILAQAELPILEEDNVSTLFEKLSIVGRDCFMATLPSVFDGTVVATPQNSDLVTFSPALKPEQERLNWNLPARTLHNHIRAMNEWPGAYTLFKGERFKIWVSRVSENLLNEPAGTIVKTAQTLSVVCGDGVLLELLVVQPAGKSKMLSADFCRGLGSTLQKGDQFE